VIDGGANVGHVTEACARIVGPAGMVIAVEPDPRCHTPLDALASRFECVRVVRAALEQDDFPSTLYLADRTTESSLLRNAVRDVVEERQVDSITIDQLTKRTVKAVKLDLQGGEYAALWGASYTMGRCHHWIVELWPHVLGPLKGELLLWLFQNLDFNVLWMDAGYPVADYKDVLAYLKADHERHEHINVVFKRAGA
jgi:FkbM family methyltransferase